MDRFRRFSNRTAGAIPCVTIIALLTMPACGALEQDETTKQSSGKTEAAATLKQAAEQLITSIAELRSHDAFKDITGLKPLAAAEAEALGVRTATTLRRSQRCQRDHRLQAQSSHEPSYVHRGLHLSGSPTGASHKSVVRDPASRDELLARTPDAGYFEPKLSKLQGSASGSRRGRSRLVFPSRPSRPASC